MEFCESTENSHTFEPSHSRAQGASQDAIDTPLIAVCYLVEQEASQLKAETNGSLISGL